MDKAAKDVRAVPLSLFKTGQVGYEDGTSFPVVGVAALQKSGILAANGQGTLNLPIREAVGPEVINGTAPRGLIQVPTGRSGPEVLVSLIENVWQQIYVDNKAHDVTEKVRLMTLDPSRGGGAAQALAEYDYENTTQAQDVPMGPAGNDWALTGTEADAIAVQNQPPTTNMFCNVARPASIQGNGELQTTPSLFKSVPIELMDQEFLIMSNRGVDRPGDLGDNPPPRLQGYPC